LNYGAVEPIVVDNGSVDDSVARVAESYPDVTILQAGENLGYAGGNNLGIKHALSKGADYVWLLNDDVTVAPDSLSLLMSTADAQPKAGFWGPTVYMHEEPRRILSAGGCLGKDWAPQHRGIGELDVGQFGQIETVDYVSGCALLVSRALVDAVGLLDERFFAYCEEVEWCYRGRQAGFGALFVPQAAVWHPDTRSRDRDSVVVKYYMSRNQLLFMAKHRLGASAMVHHLASYTLWIANWTVNPKWRHKRRQRDMLLRAVFDFVRGRYGKAEGLS
jgi:GT2 family glycosyltransferase